MLLLNPFLRRTTSRSAMPGRTRAWSRDRLTAESLEIRSLLSASWPGLHDPQPEAEPNNTLDVAQDVGNVGRGEVAEFVGRIGDGGDFATDVDWYSFKLVSAGRVQLTALPGAGGATSPVVLTLYGDQLAEFDPALPLQHRLLGRQEGHSDVAARPVDLRLEAGTYFVAVSGAGNRHFHPFVADSGTPGEVTDYGVRIAVTGGRIPTQSHDQFSPVAESGTVGDDTSATAKDLGDLTAIPRMQVSGTIGDDRFYNVASKDLFAMNPASDVDLYRFSITGDGTFALIAETFAGRIGSPLDPALTLFRADDVGGLQLVTTNNNSLNSVESTNGQIPFFSDAVLFSSLSAGEYFLAVSSSGNDVEYGSGGVFDPQVAHSGLNGGSVGKYVVDLTVYADTTAPQVVRQIFNLPGSIRENLTTGQVENFFHAPTHLSLQFSEPVNVQQLANAAFTSVGQNAVSAVFIEAADGTRYFPRFESYDTATETAQFLMLDGLPNGEFELHVSGGLGLTDLAGNPIVGNDASGDFVTRFTVADTNRVEVPALRLNASGNDSFETAQDLGVLFPHELRAGIKLVRDAATNAAQPADSADYFRFELLQSKSYFFTLSNFGDGSPPAIEVLNAEGRVMPLASLPGGQGVLGFLPAGQYVLHLGSWDSASAANVTYQVELELGSASENPTPLTSGAAPAVGIHLAGHSPVAFNVPMPVQSVSATVVSGSTPMGLNNNLAALPLGLPTNSTLAASSTPNDNRIVRLFGFGDRDRLFSMIDSMLSRPKAETWSVTKATLSDADLADILKLNRQTPSVSESDATNDSAATDEEIEELPSSSLEATGEIEASATSETTEEPADSQLPLRRSAARSRALRGQPLEERPTDDQQPSAVANPMAIALAFSLASTLREHARREREQTDKVV